MYLTTWKISLSYCMAGNRWSIKQKNSDWKRIKKSVINHFRSRNAASHTTNPKRFNGNCNLCNKFGHKASVCGSKPMSQNKFSNNQHSKHQTSLRSHSQNKERRLSNKKHVSNNESHKRATFNIDALQENFEESDIDDQVATVNTT